jgi:hypothetical protein
MEVRYERRCGLDIHKKFMVACLLTPGPKGRPPKELRTFGTMPQELLGLVGWLEGATWPWKAPGYTASVQLSGRPKGAFSHPSLKEDFGD